MREPNETLLIALTGGGAESVAYQELRRRAAGQLRREHRRHTWQPTALVNEAYLRLVGQRRVVWQNRG